MLKYLIIQLDDTATSFCHYSVSKAERKPISLDDLRSGVLFAMKENLNIQFLYPDYALPPAYAEVVESIDHVKIVSSRCEDTVLKEDADIIVFNGWSDIDGYLWDADKTYILRTAKTELFERFAEINFIVNKVQRLNIVITDVESFRDEDFDAYKRVLAALSDNIEKQCLDGKFPQFNLLTDRMLLDAMNNCNAGAESVTLAPDGNFYVCPGFYNDGASAVGNITDGLNIKNFQLYSLDHAPICRICDAWQCKRCIWLNHKLTLEVNTPGREQCVTAHLERNASARLLSSIRTHGAYLPDKQLAEVECLDPFEKLTNQ